ncbi:MAG: hypothetical protein IPM47_07340 [Sphingobacteriales bacterium]|nr:MAG: hypothetical protein IPM47_07340 [Sphingobacteriales bacterium]
MKKIMQSVRPVFFLALYFISVALFGQNDIQYYRPYDQRGVHVFETPKQPRSDETGFKVRVGGHFAQQFQALQHESDQDTLLTALKPGFNLATANLNIDAQLQDGISVSLVTYLSARHHPEAWVKGGYLQIDKALFLKSEFVDKIMENLTFKFGHFEINYGDAHFRRTDNGNAMWNPFVGNYILDAFTTEIGGEVIYQCDKGLLAVFSMTGGEIKGDVSEPVVTTQDDKAKRSPSIIGKFGYDKQLTEDLRLRATASAYYTASSTSNTLYGGDRTGSRYYLVLEPQTASAQTNFTSGRYNPGFRDKVTAVMGNVFLKYKGAELFGTYEMASGRANNETDTRKVSQLAGELLYRFGKNEQFFAGARYCRVNAEHLASGNVSDINIDRIQGSVGAFVTKNILAKVEYVTQNYNDFPAADLRSNGKFNGVMVEGVIGF